ncbi:Helix-turn-helix domain (DUF4817) [Popillia japonica]|uniref:Helix-turn-helix domain (DUF4817) n=1 Tax=Popillia japonica TaxID=7064 RepID=A0AAW1NJT9_POPJA
MASYPTEVRVELIKYYYRNGESFAATARHLRTLFGRNNASTENTIKRIVVKFEATASAADERSTVRERQNTIRVPETIERVGEHFTAQPSTSISRASQGLEIPRTTLRRILKQDLKMKPYKIQINQPLRPFDMERRFDFANEIIERIENGSMSLQRVWRSDVSHFDVSGYVNKQNWRHWGTDNPHLAVVCYLVGRNYRSRDCQWNRYFAKIL